MKENNLLLKTSSNLLWRFAERFGATGVMLDASTLKVVLKNRNADLPAGSVVQSRSIVRDQVGSFFERCKNRF